MVTLLALVGAFAVLVVVTMNVAVTRAADGLAFDVPSEVPERPVAIVFGAGVVDGHPTPALADRIDGAVELFREGRVSQLLMTGDNSSVAYDEVTVMRDVAIAAGVPASAITRDHAGFNTYDSCYRAKAIFGVHAAVLVTQDYHLSRALYTCTRLGIDAVGLRIPDWQHLPDRLTRGQYSTGMGVQYMTREWLARANAVVAIKVVHPEPTFLGPYEGLTGT